MSMQRTRPPAHTHTHTRTHVHTHVHTYTHTHTHTHAHTLPKHAGEIAQLSTLDRPVTTGLILIDRALHRLSLFPITQQLTQPDLSMHSLTRPPPGHDRHHHSACLLGAGFLNYQSEKQKLHVLYLALQTQSRVNIIDFLHSSPIIPSLSALPPVITLGDWYLPSWPNGYASSEGLWKAEMTINRSGDFCVMRYLSLPPDWLWLVLIVNTYDLIMSFIFLWLNAYGLTDH